MAQTLLVCAACVAQTLLSVPSSVWTVVLHTRTPCITRLPAAGFEKCGLKRKCPLPGRGNGLSALECAVWVAAIVRISDDFNVAPRPASVTTVLEDSTIRRRSTGGGPGAGRSAGASITSLSSPQARTDRPPADSLRRRSRRPVPSRLTQSPSVWPAAGLPR